MKAFVTQFLGAECPAQMNQADSSHTVTQNREEENKAFVGVGLEVG
jgi:hypothetical protein